MIVAVLAIAGYGMYQKFFGNKPGKINSVGSADLTLENNGVIGYTIADFADVILGKATDTSKLIVREQEASVTTTETQAGWFGLEIFSKTKNITYYGTGYYIVNLETLDTEDIEVDNDNQQVILYVPQAEFDHVNVDLDKTEFEDTKKGSLSFGDIKLTAEQENEIKKEAKAKLKEKLTEDEEMEEANKSAKEALANLFQPIITQVASDYDVVIEFNETTES